MVEKNKMPIYNEYMNSKNSKFGKSVHGFTLVEIMIVVTIIGILASLAVPAFQRARWKALETSIRNNLRQIWGAAQQYMLENGVDLIKITDIVAWQDKGGTKTGTDMGYTSVIQQIANESYSSVVVYTDTSTGFTMDEYSKDSGTDSESLYSTTQAIAIEIPDNTPGGKPRYVKLRL